MKQLVELAKQGNQDAIGQLYEMTNQKAYFLALQILKDEDEAWDILHNSYIKALENLGTLKDNDKFQGWLDSIVINNSRNYLKKKKPELFWQVKDEDEVGMLEDRGEEFVPEQVVDYSETKRLIREMLDTLPDEQRIPIVLYYMEERSVKEIAEYMECSEGTIKSRLNYGRKALKIKVKELEKKGTKLYCQPLVPFLYWFFKEQVAACTLPAAAADGLPLLLSQVGKGLGSGAVVGKTGVGIVAANMKMIIGGVLLGGAVLSGVYYVSSAGHQNETVAAVDVRDENTANQAGQGTSADELESPERQLSREEIEAMYLAYLESNLYPQYGKLEQFTCDYGLYIRHWLEEDLHGYGIVPSEYEEGILTYKIVDMYRDEDPELLVFRLFRDYDYEDGYPAMSIKLSMYQVDAGNIVLVQEGDVIKGLFDKLEHSFNVFIREAEEGYTIGAEAIVVGDTGVGHSSDILLKTYHFNENSVEIEEKRFYDMASPIEMSNQPDDQIILSGEVRSEGFPTTAYIAEWDEYLDTTSKFELLEYFEYGDGDISACRMKGEIIIQQE